MKEARYFYVPDAPHQKELPQEEAQHAARVLRLHEGDEVFLMDGVGIFYRAVLTLVANKHCSYDIIEALPQERTWRGHIHLAIAPTKDIGRIEWMAEKATEMGFDELSFLNCRFSERKVVREDRIEKIVLSAVKQSRKAWVPIVNEMMTFREFVQQQRKGRKFICHCYEEIEKKDLWTELSSLHTPPASLPENITILVGPEGDFSIDEVRQAMDCGYESVTLGSSRLRTETAGLTVVFMSNLSLRNGGEDGK